MWHLRRTDALYRSANNARYKRAEMYFRSSCARYTLLLSKFIFSPAIHTYIYIYSIIEPARSSLKRWLLKCILLNGCRFSHECDELGVSMFFPPLMKIHDYATGIFSIGGYPQCLDGAYEWTLTLNKSVTRCWNVCPVLPAGSKIPCRIIDLARRRGRSCENLNEYSLSIRKNRENRC